MEQGTEKARPFLLRALFFSFSPPCSPETNPFSRLNSSPLFSSLPLFSHFTGGTCQLPSQSQAHRGRGRVRRRHRRRAEGENRRIGERVFLGFRERRRLLASLSCFSLLSRLPSPLLPPLAAPPPTTNETHTLSLFLRAIKQIQTKNKTTRSSSPPLSSTQ